MRKGSRLREYGKQIDGGSFWEFKAKGYPLAVIVYVFFRQELDSNRILLMIDCIDIEILIKFNKFYTRKIRLGAVVCDLSAILSERMIFARNVPLFK